MRNPRPLLFALAASALLNACVAGPAPEIATPTPDLPEAFFFEADGETQAGLDALLPVDDPAFERLVSAAIKDAPSLAEAIARIDVARAQAARAGANRLPSIAADGAATGTRINPNQFGSNNPFAQAIDTEQVSYGVNITASWDADVFGQLRAQERAASARIDAANASATGVRIALLSEIAGSVTDWRTIQARSDAIVSDVTAAERLASLASAREQAGIAPGFDRVRAQANAAASRSRLAALESEKARIIGRLVTLTGQAAATVSAQLEQHAPSISVAPAPARLPSDLLVNRPDVAFASAQLAASDADLAATARARFPRLTLSGVLGLLAFNPGDLFDEDALVGSLAAGVAAPLFDFGRIEAEIDGAAANKIVAFQAYRGAVFQALGDAETAYGLVNASDREARLAEQERDQLQRAARLANDRYRAGLSSFLEVLDAQRAADASGERAADAFGRARRARILLWQALGGSTLGSSGGS